MFSKSDLIIINKLQFDPKSPYSFDPFRGCLVWVDERPFDLSMEGYDILRDLWVARYFLYHDRTPTSEFWKESKGEYSAKWNDAINYIPTWPGFMKQRLELGNEERIFLQYERENQEEL